MKPSATLLATFSLALAIGVAQAQSQPAQPQPAHEHAAPAADAKPAAAQAAQAPAAGTPMMGCGAMMHGQGGMHGGGAMMHGDASGKTDPPSMMMHGAMGCGEGANMRMSGDVDKDFATMMIMHHQQAIRMADIEIANGKNAELKAMAKKMRESQLAEIEKLKKHQ
jgi:uncharacterized protein (DUF305 family)